MSTRTPCANPADAMAIVAMLLGVRLKRSVGYLDAFPECETLELHLGGFEAWVYVGPTKKVIDDEEYLVISCTVNWSSSRMGAEEAAIAAALHTLAAQKAALVESVAQGRRWKVDDVLAHERADHRHA